MCLKLGKIPLPNKIKIYRRSPESSTDTGFSRQKLQSGYCKYVQRTLRKLCLGGIKGLHDSNTSTSRESQYGDLMIP